MSEQMGVGRWKGPELYGRRAIVHYPGTTNLGVNQFAEWIDGELVRCPDQEEARRIFEAGHPGAEITDPAAISARIRELTNR